MTDGPDGEDADKRSVDELLDALNRAIEQLDEQLVRVAEQQAVIRECLGAHATEETGCPEESLRRNFEHEVKVQVLLTLQPLLARIHTLEDRVSDLERK